MLKDNPASRGFIRVSIFLLRSVAPLSTAYCIVRVAGWRPFGAHIALHVVDAYAAAEVGFYLLCRLRRWWLNRPAPKHTLTFSSAERKALFIRTWESTPNPRNYLSLWFKGAPIEDLSSDDVKDWISWRMWNEIKRSPENEEELEEYLAHLEGVLKWKFPDGRSTHTSMAVTFEPLPIIHRPLVWYIVSLRADPDFGTARLTTCASVSLVVQISKCAPSCNIMALPSTVAASRGC